MKVVGMIPARYKSSRFPGKPLVNLYGKPMVVRVADIAARALGAEYVYVLTDDVKIKDAVEHYGYKVLMTSDECETGTDRLVEGMKQVEADIYINIQGDEPILDYKEIIKVVEFKKKVGHGVINCMSKITEHEDPMSLNIPKIVASEKDRHLIYASRSLIPGSKIKSQKDSVYWKQVCIYAFSASDLKAFGETNGKCSLEIMEDIEILRFLELGIPVYMLETESFSLAIDVPEDIQNVEKVMKERGFDQ